MIRISQKLKEFLPESSQKMYVGVGQCIYCGNVENLGDEHIVPFGLGGRMIIPKASCNVCSGISSAFEGVCLRTMFGPLRMLYDLPSRRKKDRPKKLPLKIKNDLEGEWKEIYVDREEYPFLVLFPRFQMPELLSGVQSTGNRGAATDKFWIRGASASGGIFKHMDRLIAKLGVRAVMPEAKAHVEEFCLMLAKIAHAYATAEIGYRKFEPLLLNMICRRNLTNRADFIGSLPDDESPSSQLHEISLYNNMFNKPDLVVVRIRFLSKLGTPTYFIVTGRHILSQ